ncbi:MAG TPA: nicotinate (nicotinamide) nucleotide adenylyltransferase [Candidatus Ozemobacteraceae bacterium]|nr:nicotinate (nicotinamide) nucleotide adenylyltransferase [Candidatus Ozemobacteraceae bacterium]
MKIGLFGGSFNPVHRHHVRIAEAVRETCGLDEVWLVPVHQPVHKHCGELLRYEDRRAMLETAIRDIDGLRICDAERELGGPSYTIRTLQHLRERFPEHEFLLVIGADSLRDLPGWKSADRLMVEAGFAVVVRPGIENTLELPNDRSVWVPIEPDRASSTAIRESIRRGRLKRLPVPSRVMAMIVEAGHYGCWQGRHLLWRDALMERCAAIQAGLRGHIESVARLAAEYAFDLGQDPRLGYLAGLAHDLYRADPPDQILAAARGYRMRLRMIERNAPMLAHGAAAAGYLATLRPLPPLALRRAVRWHTFPKQDHAPLTRALVMADALDPSRVDPQRNRLRRERLAAEARWEKVVSLKRSCAGCAERRSNEAAPGTMQDGGQAAGD